MAHSVYSHQQPANIPAMHMVPSFGGNPLAAQARPQTGNQTMLYTQSGPMAFASAAPPGMQGAMGTNGFCAPAGAMAMPWAAYQQPQMWTGQMGIVQQPMAQPGIFDLGATAGASGAFAFGGGPLAGTYLHMANAQQTSESQEIQLQDLKGLLGIATMEDEELYGWIAEYGLQDDALPPQWSRHTDVVSGAAYYSCEGSEVTVWENPLTPHLKRIIETGRSYMQSPNENFFEEQKVLLWHHHKVELDDWHGPLTDSEGQGYFVNSTSGKTSVHDPREHTQYIFELECCLLDRLQDVLPPPSAFWEPSPMTTTIGSRLNRDAQDEVTSPNNINRPARRASALTQQAGKFDHRSLFSTLSNDLIWLRETRGDEAEKQRHNFSRKVAARKMRLQVAAAKEGFGTAARRPPQPQTPKDTPTLSPTSPVRQSRDVSDRSREVDLEQSLMMVNGQSLLHCVEGKERSVERPLSPTLQSLPGGLLPLKELQELQKRFAPDAR